MGSYVKDMSGVDGGRRQRLFRIKTHGVARGRSGRHAKGLVRTMDHFNIKVVVVVIN